VVRAAKEEIRSLPPAGRHLKAFARTKLVRDAPELAEEVRATRKKVKKTRRRLQALVAQVEVATESTDDDGT
jgi:hypothetical protein